MKKHLSNLLLVLVFVAGLSLLLYPTVSDYWNSFHQSRVVMSYTEQVAQLDTSSYQAAREAAQAYNATLPETHNRFYMPDEARAVYDSLLNVTGTGVMATLEIPDLGVNLPVYHGTSEAVLQVALGHVEGSSLPVGGAGTHCVISGHRGLPSAKLFSNLDQLAVGDVFLLRVLDETLTYQVDQILVVEPEDMEPLAIFPGEDYCTLVTCTPYGINSHRLLVRGTRIETEEAVAVVHVTSDAAMLSPLIVAAVIAVPLLLVWFIGMMLFPRKR